MVTILVRERLLGLMSMLVGLSGAAAMLELAAAPAPQPFTRSLGLLAAAGLATLLLLPALLGRFSIPEPWRGHLRTAFSMGASSGTAHLLGWSLVALGLWLVAVQFIANQLGLEISWLVLMVVVTSVELVRTVPLTIQGIGLREGAFASLLALFGYAPESGFILGAAAYLALNLALVVTGAIGAVMLGRPDTPD